jgi:hypothetical protein
MLAHFSPQAGFGQRDRYCILVHVKADIGDRLRHDPSPIGECLARTFARQRSSVQTLIPTVCETASTGELSSGNNRATTRSLNF